jgi:phosphatidate cytidylyltransferase
MPDPASALSETSGPDGPVVGSATAGGASRGPEDGAATADVTRRGSRAGRDLRSAIGVGLLLGALVIGTLTLDARAFLVVVAAAVSIGAWEVRRGVAAKGMSVPLVPLVLGTVGMLAPRR